MLFKGNEVRKLSAKEIYKMEKKEGIEKIENLINDIIKRQITNPVPWECSEQFQEIADYQNHADLSVLFGELMYLSHEFEGLNGMFERLHEIRVKHGEFMQKEYQNFEDFRNAYPEQWKEFYLKTKEV